MTFKVGEKVIYPNQGVGVIEDVSSRTIAGCCQQFYMVRIDANDSTVMVPVNNAENVGMRTLSDGDQVRKLFEILEMEFAEPDPDWKSRYKVNLEKMNSGDVCEVAKVLRNLYFLSFRKSLSFREKKMFDRAKHLVISEIATVKKQDLEKTENEVESILDATYQKTVGELENVEV
jgi:CarD family transcriptional regulator